MKKKMVKQTRALWEPNVMTAEEAMAWLDGKGISYEVCDTPVPLLGNKVNCGTPLGIGDEMIEGYYYVPKSRLGNNPVLDWPAVGDSMIDANIEDGDILRVELGAQPRDGDIVVASLDNEYTAKVFFTDDYGERWLCPRNSRYDCISLKGCLEVRIVGVVQNILKQAPHHSYRECKSIVEATLSRHQQQDSLQERVRKAVADGSHLFWAASAWAVVYGVVRDCHGYEGSVIDFERKAIALDLPPTFDHCCSVGKVQRTISNHPYMRLHIDKWKENGASVREIVLMDFLRNNI